MLDSWRALDDVAFANEMLGLTSFLNVSAAIKIEGDRLSKRSLDMTGVEAPPKQ
jgi:hypothetical protein